MHLVIDAYGRNNEILQSEDFIYRLLDQYPAEIGMTKISTPYVLRYTGKEWGLSGFVIIAESHISIHTFVERSYVNLDVFSCKNFDTEVATRNLTDRLYLTDVKVRVFDRDEYSIASHRDSGIV